MNADLETSYPITSAPPAWAAPQPAALKAPCLECNYPTTDPEQLCSIACRNRVNRNRRTAPLTWGDGLQKIVHTPGGTGGPWDAPCGVRAPNRPSGPSERRRL